MNMKNNMNYKIYIASSLKNWKRVRGLRDRLAGHGIGLTYDWTPHAEAIYSDGEVADKGGIPSLDELGIRGWDELKGVIEARYLLVVLPGERGTHMELGACYTMHVGRGTTGDKLLLTQPGYTNITILMGQDTAEIPTSFHYMKGIKRTTSEDEAIEHILKHLGINQT